MIIKLLEVFRKTPPREQDLRNVSLLYQENQGTNTPEEYAVLTIWISMQQFIIESENHKKQIHSTIDLVKENISPKVHNLKKVMSCPSFTYTDSSLIRGHAPL